MDIPTQNYEGPLSFTNCHFSCLEFDLCQSCYWHCATCHISGLLDAKAPGLRKSQTRPEPRSKDETPHGVNTARALSNLLGFDVSKLLACRFTVLWVWWAFRLRFAFLGVMHCAFMFQSSSSDSGQHRLLCSMVALKDEELKESQCPRLKVGADDEFDICFYSCPASA